MMLRPSYLDLINVVNNEAEPGKEPLIQNCFISSFIFSIKVL